LGDLKYKKTEEEILPLHFAQGQNDPFLCHPEGFSPKGLILEEILRYRSE